jgi:hypothetical protein
MLKQMTVLAALVAVLGCMTPVYGEFAFEDDFEDMVPGDSEDIFLGLPKWVVGAGQSFVYITATHDNNNGNRVPLVGGGAVGVRTFAGEALNNSVDAVAQFAALPVGATQIHMSGKISISAGTSGGANNWPQLGIVTNNGFTGLLLPGPDTPNANWDTHWYTDAQNGSEQLDVWNHGSTFGEDHQVDIWVDSTNTKIRLTRLEGVGGILEDTMATPAGTIIESIIMAGNGGVFFDDINITPEPASLALLSLGGLMMLRRRR